MLHSAGALPEGARVLDMYAGSGALAFEALSRGAASAVLVEHARDAARMIRHNARELGLDARVELLPVRVERALDRLQGPFDVIFADPPYSDVVSSTFASVLGRAALLLPREGRLILEHSSADEPPVVAGLLVERSRRHGDTALSIYAPDPASPRAETHPG